MMLKKKKLSRILQVNIYKFQGHSWNNLLNVHILAITIESWPNPITSVFGAYHTVGF